MLERLWVLLSSGLIFLHISAHEFKCKSIYLRIYESENDDTCADKSCLYGGRRPYYYISMTKLLEPNGAQPTECSFLPKELISSIHLYDVSNDLVVSWSWSVKNHQNIVMNYQLHLYVSLIILKKSRKGEILLMTVIGNFHSILKHFIMKKWSLFVGS